MRVVGISHIGLVPCIVQMTLFTKNTVPESWAQAAMNLNSRDTISLQLIPRFLQKTTSSWRGETGSVSFDIRKWEKKNDIQQLN